MISRSNTESRIWLPVSFSLTFEILRGVVMGDKEKESISMSTKVRDGAQERNSQHVCVRNGRRQGRMQTHQLLVWGVTQLQKCESGFGCRSFWPYSICLKFGQISSHLFQWMSSDCVILKKMCFPSILLRCAGRYKGTEKSKILAVAVKGVKLCCCRVVQRKSSTGSCTGSHTSLTTDSFQEVPQTSSISHQRKAPLVWAFSSSVLQGMLGCVHLVWHFLMELESGALHLIYNIWRWESSSRFLDSSTAHQREEWRSAMCSVLPAEYDIKSHSPSSSSVGGPLR